MALALWRGEPLADVESDALALREVPRLAELRLQALEVRIDADLHLGRHGRSDRRAAGSGACHPLREQLHALLMLALYRCGRQAEALAAYERAAPACSSRSSAPSPAADLQTLHRQILTATRPWRAGRRAGQGGRHRRGCRARQLPAWRRISPAARASWPSCTGCWARLASSRRDRW